MTDILVFLSVGGDNDRESSLSLSPDTDTEYYYEDKNMALFEVTLLKFHRQRSWYKDPKPPGDLQTF